MDVDNLEDAFESFSMLYGVGVSDFEKQEIVKNVSGFFASLNDAELRKRN